MPAFGRRAAGNLGRTVAGALMFGLLAILGLESSSLTVAFDLAGIAAAVVYVALIYWTYSDAGSRLSDPLMVGVATAIALVPFAGPLVYLIVRPAETIQDAQERDLEVEAMRLRLHELESRLCPHCDYPIDPDYLACPSCLRRLKERCAGCSRPLEQIWTICPYCEREVSAAPARSRRSARRGEGGPVAAARPGDEQESERDGAGSRAEKPERGESANRPGAPAGAKGTRRAAPRRAAAGATEDAGARAGAGAGAAGARAAGTGASGTSADGGGAAEADTAGARSAEAGDGGRRGAASAPPGFGERTDVKVGRRRSRDSRSEVALDSPAAGAEGLSGERAETAAGQRRAARTSSKQTSERTPDRT